MAFLSTPKTSVNALVGLCRIAELLGARVGEMYGFRTPAKGVHNAISLHYGKDAKTGYGYAADINENVPGVNPPTERALLIRILKIARSLGLAVTYALDGTKGSAAGHTGHLHVDIAQWSNLGLGDERARTVTYTGSEVFTVLPAVGLRGRKSASTLATIKHKRPKGYALTIKAFKVSGKYVWGKATDGTWYALVSLNGKETNVKAGCK